MATMVLPPLNVYDNQILQLEKELYKLTGETISAETAKMFAKRQVYKCTYSLQNCHLLTPDEAKNGSLKAYFTEQDGKVVLSNKGMLFLEVLELDSSRHILEKTFIVNGLRGMKNACLKLQELLYENEFFLVDMARSIMHEVTELLEGKQTPDNHDAFLAKLLDEITKVVLPNGASDIEIPLPLQAIISKQAFLVLQEKLPRKITQLYSKATSDLIRYQILTKITDEIKAYLSGTSAVPTFEIKSVIYPQQEQFNSQLHALTLSLLGHVDDRLVRCTKGFIASKVSSYGPQIVSKISSVDIVAQANSAMKRACLKANPAGRWEMAGKEARFIYVPTPPMTPKERKAHNEASVQEMKLHLQKELKTIAQDTSGLKKRIAMKVFPSIIPMRLRRALVNIAFKVFRIDARISKVFTQFVTIAQNVDLSKALNPFKKAYVANTFL